MPPKKKGAPANSESMESLYLKHYLEEKAKYGEKTAILLQVGRFFEMYDSLTVATGATNTNMQALAEICGCAVEPKPTADPARLKLFWGFPESALDKYERMMVVAGYSVVVVTQNKDGTDKVTSRTIDHVSSPGTYFEAEGALTVRAEEQCMVGMYIEPYTYQPKDAAVRMQQRWYVAVSAFNINTGEAVSTEAHLTLIDDRAVCDAIQPFLSMYPPAEAVVWWSAGAEQPLPDSAVFSQILGLGGKQPRPPLHIRTLDKKDESGVGADRLRIQFFKDLYQPTSALSVEEHLDISRHPQVRRSLYHLLSFIRDHNASFLQRLCTHTIWEPADYLILGNAALEQLAMISPNSARAHESLLHWLQHASTAMGRRFLRTRCLTPIADTEELNSRQERIEVLRAVKDKSAYLGHLKGMYDLPRIYRRFALGKAGSQDLLCLFTTYEHCRDLLVCTTATPCGLDVEQHGLVLEHINQVLTTWSAVRIRQSCGQIGEGGGGGVPVVGSFHPWVRGQQPDLDLLEDKWTALETEALGLKQSWEKSLKEEDVINWTIKDEAPFTFTTTQRRATSLQGFFKGTKKTCGFEIVKRASSTTAVIVQNTRLGELNTAAIALRAEWVAATTAKWRAHWQTWIRTSQSTGLFETLVNWVSTFDCECAFAILADKYGYVRPNYVDPLNDTAAGFSVTALRHPIIERVRTATPYIPHSLAFGEFAKGAEGAAAAPNGLLLYGVNAAGKSSLGKAIGLAILMAQIGCPVPATAMTLIPYTGLYTRILGNDNLWAGMSSFVVEMTEFRSILRSAATRMLVIGDELCAGTETASATAIVAAGIQTLVRRGAHFLFATHLHELSEIPEIANDPKVRPYHLSVCSDPITGALIYDRALRAGAGSPMYGLEVCRGLDMDAEFLALASTLRKRMFTADGKAHTSRYNADVVVSRCTVCGADGTNSLEVHHIVPQAAADAAGYISPGQHKNTKSNLVVLCENCHQNHHSGLLEIQGWMHTSEGLKLMTK
jgi:DNA mismatch repair protein MutS